jgi:chromosome partitioning protein
MRLIREDGAEIEESDAPGGTEGARTVAVANQKGGVGKTTTAVNLGAALARVGQRVVVVDLDPQGNASTGMGVEQADRSPSSYDVLTGRVDALSALRATAVDGLSALPATVDLAGAEVELVGQVARETVLKRALLPLGADGGVVLLDCPPSLGLLTVNALCAADEVLIPLQCEYFALEGLGQLLQNLRLVQQNINPNLRLNGIVLTMFDARTKLAEQVVAEIRAHFGAAVYATVVPRSVRLSEAPGFGLPIVAYDPGSTGAVAYRSLAAEFMQREPMAELMGIASGDPPFVPDRPPPRPVQAPPSDQVVEGAPVRSVQGAMDGPRTPPSPAGPSASGPAAAPTPNSHAGARFDPAPVGQVEAMTKRPARRSWWPFGRAKGGNR